MRLLDTTTLELHEFISTDHIKYAILSHTWADGEVTFQDLSPSTRDKKKGWTKIKKTCELAKAAGYPYAWVDTCCIDKSSSAELTESINSMFKWYMDSQVCYVYLEDLALGVPIEKWLPRSRWMTRGWTLQELISPREVLFLDREWNERGSKAGLVKVLQACTNISTGVLQMERSLSSIPVAAKMSWAARRQTTRVEDTAYCLLGIFGVNMPLLYGEGMMAFRRLQEEITRRTCDLTILGWDDAECRKQAFHGLLAPHPASFAGMADLETYDMVGESFSVTNSGLRLNNTIHCLSKPPSGGPQHYVLFVGFREPMRDRKLTVLRLRKLDANTFYRQGPLLTVEERDEHYLQDCTEQNYYILIDEPVYTPLVRLLSTPRVLAIHVPSYIQVRDITPHYFWDVEDRLFFDSIFLNEKGTTAVYAILAQVMVRSQPIDIVILFDRRLVATVPADMQASCRIYEAKTQARETKWIFSPKWESECLYWPDLEFHAPALLDTTNALTIGSGKSKIRISASLKQGIVPSVSTETPVWSLNLEENIDRLELKKSATWR